MRTKKIVITSFYATLQFIQAQIHVEEPFGFLTICSYVPVKGGRKRRLRRLFSAPFPPQPNPRACRFNPFLGFPIQRLPWHVVRAAVVPAKYIATRAARLTLNSTEFTALRESTMHRGEFDAATTAFSLDIASNLVRYTETV